jgi:hypothetical protein
MKKILITFLMILGLIIAVPLSGMADNGRGHHKHYNGYNYYNRTYFNGSYYYRPAYPERYIYYPPPPVIYYEPAPYPGPYYYPPASGSLFFGINFD